MAKHVTYSSLLSQQRRRITELPGRTLEDEAESDRGRVLFSAAFRRMQGKAQVFSLETNSAIRSRLTHSIEVATIGRQVAYAALSALRKHRGGDLLRELELENKQEAFVIFVDTACLIHDLGNPPFGHFGEDAISDWFRKSGNILNPMDSNDNRYDQLWNKHLAEFRDYNGNPQSLRIVSRLQPTKQDLYGLNLTATSLASCVKYPRSLSQALEGSQDEKAKYGYFQTELDVVKWSWEALSLPIGCRHPIAALMDAADDIAYCLSDIEDGVEKGVITVRDFVQHLKEYVEGETEGGMEELKKLLNEIELGLRPKVSMESKLLWAPLRSRLNRMISTTIGARFVRNHENKEVAHYGDSLVSPEDGKRSLLNHVKNFAKEHLYSCDVVMRREMAGHSILTTLLESYKELMNCSLPRFRSIIDGQKIDKDEKPITVQRALVRRLPSKYMKIYDLHCATVKGQPLELLHERIFRIRLILDYITSMTDDFARRSFVLVSGHEAVGEH